MWEGAGWVAVELVIDPLQVAQQLIADCQRGGFAGFLLQAGQPRGFPQADGQRHRHRAGTQPALLATAK